MEKSLIPTAVLCWLCGAAISQIAGQQVRATPPQIQAISPDQLASPTQRLMIEQVDELIATGEADEALALLERLLDEANGRLVAVNHLEAASTLRTQRYLPLADWVGIRTAKLLHQFPQAATNYQSRNQAQAANALQDLQTSKNPTVALYAARRFFATQQGRDFQLLLCDLYLENGWGLAAAQVLQQLSPELRFRVNSDASPTTLLDWTLPAALVHHREEGHEPVRLSNAPNPSDPAAADPAAAAQVAEENRSEVLLRGLMAAAMNPQELDGAATQVPNSNAARLSQSRFTTWPAWSQSLEKYSANNDRVLASKPRVGESQRSTLPYFPVVHNGIVYVNEMTRIVAYDLDSGKPWPDSQSVLPLFDSHISAAAFLPLGYPLIGAPRGTLSIANDCLYARMGSPITGRMNAQLASSNGASASYLIGLDLRKQGSLLQGFPLHLNAPEFVNAEFDGTPLAWGQMLVVAVAQRDNVGLRRSVAAFDRVTGQLIWKSGILAAGSVAGSERANLISHQVLTLAGGRLYYNTNLGSIACLDPLTGDTLWLVQYSTPLESKEFLRPNRHRYRDLTPCLLSSGLVYCAPQDAPEIFALDATTGDLVWSTDDATAADAIHLLGVTQDSLIVSGDRIVWLDKFTGRLLGRFPGSTTPLPFGALPSPRGLGRGAVTGNLVYWPTAGEIWVFGADIKKPSMGQGAPKLVGRTSLDTGIGDGGNLLFYENVMLVCSPNRLMSFPALASPASAP